MTTNDLDNFDEVLEYAQDFKREFHSRDDVDNFNQAVIRLRDAVDNINCIDSFDLKEE